MLRTRFRSALEGTTEERFLALRQEGSVMANQNAFESLAAPIGDISEAILEGHFVNGLSPEIKAEVRMLQPKGLDQIMELAQKIEENNQALQAHANRSGSLKQKSSSNLNWYLPPTRNQSDPSPNTNTKPSTAKAPASTGTANLLFKRLSEAKLKANKN